MQVIRQASDIAKVRDAVIRNFLVKRISHIVLAWAPDVWEEFGQILVLEVGDDPAIVESANCSRLTANPFGAARLGDDDFVPMWDWVDDHGTFYEVALIVSDAGNFDVVLVPKEIGISSALLELCRQRVTAASLLSSGA